MFWATLHSILPWRIVFFLGRSDVCFLWREGTLPAGGDAHYLKSSVNIPSHLKSTLNLWQNTQHQLGHPCYEVCSHNHKLPVTIRILPLTTKASHSHQWRTLTTSCTWAPTISPSKPRLSLRPPTLFSSWTHRLYYPNPILHNSHKPAYTQQTISWNINARPLILPPDLIPLSPKFVLQVEPVINSLQYFPHYPIL